MFIIKKIEMFIKIVNRYLCHSARQVMEIKKNPYLTLTAQQLRGQITRQLNTQSLRIQHINTLIMLGEASTKKEMNEQVTRLVQKCMSNLNKIQSNINSYEEQELKLLQFAQLITVLESKKQIFQFNLKQLNDLTQLYTNTYSHVFSFQKQLKIYETVNKSSQLDFLRSVCTSFIHNYIKKCNTNLSQFIGYMRIFHYEICPELLQSKLKELGKYPSLCQLAEGQKLILNFFIINKGVDVKILEELKLEPNLKIKPTDDPKETCIRLQIMKHKKLQIPDLNFLDLSSWDYRHLIWISEFSSKSESQFRNRLHSAIMRLSLPQQNLPSSIFFYAIHAQVSVQKHKDINKWLCRNVNEQTKNEQNLCQMLKEIHEKQWQPFYRQFFKHVLRISLGNFKWESQNIIYYLGQIQKIDDQNMEYLRRYILNTYASLGTSRKQIPTTSYFYKILQIAKVQSFYKNL